MSAISVLPRVGDRWLWPLVLPVGLVVGYEAWSRAADNPYSPTIPAMGAAFVETWAGDGFVDHVLPSLANLARGYAL